MIHDEKTVARFMAKVAQPAHGHACWFWKQKKGGYPLFSISNKGRPASQVGWEIFNKRPFPVGLIACHNCDNGPRGCVNPDHIRADTQSSNILESRAKGRSTQGLKPKTHCVRGHELTSENRLPSRKWSECRECSRTRRTVWANAEYAKKHPNKKPYKAKK